MAIILVSRHAGRSARKHATHFFVVTATAHHDDEMPGRSAGTLRRRNYLMMRHARDTPLRAIISARAGAGSSMMPPIILMRAFANTPMSPRACRARRKVYFATSTSPCRIVRSRMPIPRYRTRGFSLQSILQAMRYDFQDDD